MAVQQRQETRSCAFNHSSNYSPEAVLPNYLWGATDSSLLLPPTTPPFLPTFPSGAERATIEELKLFKLVHCCPNVFSGMEERIHDARATSTRKRKVHVAPWLSVRFVRWVTVRDYCIANVSNTGARCGCSRPAKIIQLGYEGTAALWLPPLRRDCDFDTRARDLAPSFTLFSLAFLDRLFAADARRRYSEFLWREDKVWRVCSWVY